MADDEWAVQAKGIFSKYDANGDGFIDQDELSTILMAISDKFTKGDVSRLIKEADVNKDQRLSYTEFIDWLTGGKKDSLGRSVMENSEALLNLFNVYDRDGTCMITTTQFQECHVILQAALRSVLDEDP